MASSTIVRKRANFTSIGNTDANNRTRTIAFDLSNYDFVYAVGYSGGSAQYVGGILMPVFLFDIHNQVIDYYNFWTGIVAYNSSTKTVTLTSSSVDYSLYLFAVRN